MKLLDSTRDLLLKLNNGEKRALERFIKSFTVTRGENQNKMLPLLKLLMSKNKTITNDEIENLINGDQPKNTFTQLIIRLRDKIFESLLLEINLERPNVRSPYFIVRWEIRKLTICASILHGRGAINQAMELYSKIIPKCIEYELWDELIETLYNEHWSKTLRDGISEEKFFQRKMEHLEFCRRASIKASAYYQNLIVSCDFNANFFENIATLKAAILEIENDLEKTDSKVISLYYLYLKIHYYQQLNQNEEARLTCIKLVELVKTSKVVFTKKRLGLALMELANSELYTQQFNNSITNLNEARPLVAKNPFNEAVALEIEFYANFYSRKFNASLKIINYVLSNKQFNQSPFIEGKRNYLKACCLFMKGEHKKVTEVLNNVEEIKEDKEGWNIGMRILSIMNDIERPLPDNADYKIDCLRKHIENIKPGFRNERIEGILQLLKALKGNSYDFTKTFNANRKIFDQLKTGKGNISWKIKSAELLIFHSWFESKLKRIPFNNNLRESNSRKNKRLEKII